MRVEHSRYRTQVRGCLLGGAIGDALGAPIEFRSLREIRDLRASNGLTEFQQVRFGTAHGYGLITDDTQMTMFLVEGIIRAGVRRDRGIGFHIGNANGAFHRWLATQTSAAPTGPPDGWVGQERWLYSRRAPGNTCLTALQSKDRPGAPAVNDSKGCGAVMRSAPVGLLGPFCGAEHAFEMAVESAAYTHGHRTGQVAAGALAYLIARILDDDHLETAVAATIRHLSGMDGHEETSEALVAAVNAARVMPTGPETVERIGEGWIAEEALAIAVYCALTFPSRGQIGDALELAVTHSGDSDSTGAICGNILGTLHGEDALPPELAFEVEGRGTILVLADDLVWEFTVPDRLHGDYGPYTRWIDRYPPH